MNGVSAFQEKKRQYGKHILREVALLMLPGEGNKLRSFDFLFCFHDWKRLMTGGASSALPRSRRSCRGSMLPVPDGIALSSDREPQYVEEQDPPVPSLM